MCGFQVAVGFAKHPHMVAAIPLPNDPHGTWAIPLLWVRALHRFQKEKEAIPLDEDEEFVDALASVLDFLRPRNILMRISMDVLIFVCV